MPVGISLLVGGLLGIFVLACVLAVCMVGFTQVLLFLQGVLGIDLGASGAKKIIHATDIHYISPALTDNGSYFTEMVENSDGKVMLEMEALADAFITQMLAEAPDVLVLSGDLTFNGARQSHLDFIKKLTILTDAGIAVYAMPGNHDLNSPYAACFVGDSYTLEESITPEEFRTLYAPFGYASETLIAAHDASLSYMVQISDTQALLFVDVNGSGITGVITEETIAWVEQQLIAAQGAGLQVVAVSHQNIMDHSSMLSFRYTIIKGEPLLALYEKYGVLCNLSGHVHMQHIATAENGVVDIATGALSVCPNQYGVLSWQDDALSYQTVAVEMPLWGETVTAQKTQYETFALYSMAFFQDGHNFNVATALDGIASNTEIAEIQNWVLQTNTYYFAGRRDLITPNRKALSLLNKSGAFIAKYFNSIFEDELRNDTVWSNGVET